MLNNIMSDDLVILVDEFDDQKGIASKMEAHQNGLLHRAFSVLILDYNRKMLLQQRALSKYHTGGLWSNAACGHPRPDESILDAANRRLMEEMGIRGELRALNCFIYRCVFSNKLIEYEYDHIFIADYTYSNDIKSNPYEVHDYKWMEIDDLKQDILKNPEIYTPWFKMILENPDIIL